MNTKYDEEYVYCEYKSKYKKSLLELLNSEWKYSEKYFDWKYQNNPFREKVIGWLTLHNDKVIGFRGLMARNISKFNEHKIKVFPFGDGIIHKDYRRKGIFSKLNQYSIKNLSNYWDKDRDVGFTYLMSSNQFSTPAYLKMNWNALCRRKMLVYQNFSGIVLKKGSGKKYLENIFYGLDRLINMFLTSGKNNLGTSKFFITPIIASNLMTDLNQRCIVKDRLFQQKDNRYFNWRFKNPNEKYIASYLVNSDNKLVSYAIFLERRKTRCLVDYCYKKTEDLELLMINSFLRLKPKFTYALGIGKSKKEFEDLSNMGFKEPSLAYKLLPSLYSVLGNNLYFIVIPFNIENEEKGWMVDGFDLSDINNWKLDMIDDDGT